MGNIQDEKRQTVVQVLPDGVSDEAEFAQEFTRKEHALGFWEAMRRHWPAVAWASFMNLVGNYYICSVEEQLLTCHRRPF